MSGAAKGPEDLPRRIHVPLDNRWGGGSMAVLDFGPAERPVDLVFVHANGSNARTYRRLLAPLARGDVAAARSAVAMIVGRDTAALDPPGIATAAIESLAESFCDGVVMPAFWFLIAGLPGLAAAKAINTADSMIGHRTPHHIDFGWAAARADDVAAWLPARIAGLLLCLAGRGGWRVMLRDAATHASPNGGWPEAAMAGALGRRLGGPVRYDGEPAWRASLGDGPLSDAADLARSLRLYRGACLLLWLLAGGIAWAL